MNTDSLALAKSNGLKSPAKTDSASWKDGVPIVLGQIALHLITFAIKSTTNDFVSPIKAALNSLFILTSIVSTARDENAA